MMQWQRLHAAWVHVGDDAGRPLTAAVLRSIVGVFVNDYYHKRQDREERLARKKARGKGSTSNSSFGPERLAGMYGSIP